VKQISQHRKLIKIYLVFKILKEWIHHGGKILVLRTHLKNLIIILIQYLL